MAKDLYDKVIEEEKKDKGRGVSKKMLALVLVVIVIGAAGFLMFSGIGATIFGERIVSSDQAANALSGLGNDIGGISNDLKDIDNKL